MAGGHPISPPPSPAPTLLISSDRLLRSPRPPRPASMAAMSLSGVSEGCAGGCGAEEEVGGGGGGGGSGCWEGGSERGGRPVLASGSDK